MPGAEVVGLPKDRKDRTLHIGDEVLVYRDGKPCSQGEVTGMTLEMLNPTIWCVCLYMGTIGDRRYRTSCEGFRPDELERIEVGIDDTD